MLEILIYLVVAFVAGVLTFLAPCTLPILPAYFAHSSKGIKSQLTTNTFFFALGLSLVLTILGIFAGTIGKILFSYKREIVYVIGSIIILFGIMSIIGKSFNLLKMSKKRNSSSFLFGMVFALTWTGCIGPILGLMLVLAAATETAILGGLLLFIYGIGLVTPLIILSKFLDKLPKDGRFWKLMKGKLFEINFRNKKYYVHTTNIISGVLFISLGVFLILEGMFKLTGNIYFITDLVFNIESFIIEIFKIY